MRYLAIIFVFVQAILFSTVSAGVIQDLIGFYHFSTSTTVAETSQFQLKDQCFYLTDDTSQEEGSEKSTEDEYEDEEDEEEPDCD